MIAAPRQLGGCEDFRLMVDEMGRAWVMRHLAVSRQQVAAWLRPNASVPRAAVLALYWETQYGRSVVDCDHHQEMGLLHTQLAIDRTTIRTLNQRVATLECELAESTARSANDRWFRSAEDEAPNGGERARLRSP